MATKTGAGVSAAGTRPVCVFGPLSNSSVKPESTQKAPSALHLNLKVALWLLWFETWEEGAGPERFMPRLGGSHVWAWRDSFSSLVSVGLEIFKAEPSRIGEGGGGEPSYLCGEETYWAHYSVFEWGEVRWSPLPAAASLQGKGAELHGAGAGQVHQIIAEGSRRVGLG